MKTPSKYRLDTSLQENWSIALLSLIICTLDIKVMAIGKRKPFLRNYYGVERHFQQQLSNCFPTCSNARQNFNGHFIFIRFPFPMAFYFQIQIVTSAVPSPTMGPTKKKRGEKADYHYYTAVENGRTFGDGKLFMDSFSFFFYIAFFG